MTKLSRQERRRAERINLVTFCPAVFQLRGHTCHALMVNVSQLGAKFHINDMPENFAPETDEVIQYTIHTPYGESKCSARTSWVRKTDEGVEWGTEFTELSKKEDDPLRCLIDSPF